MLEQSMSETRKLGSRFEQAFMILQDEPVAMARQLRPEKPRGRSRGSSNAPASGEAPSELLHMLNQQHRLWDVDGAAAEQEESSSEEEEVFMPPKKPVPRA
jgi:hypothetical protein